jgi:peptidoglycan-associated lipoprotein
MIDRKNAWRLAALAAVLTAAMLLSGCAKKAVKAPPESPPAPPQATQEAPHDTTTPPVPHETPPAPHQMTASDLQPVFFDLDSSTLRDDARSTLDANAHLLRDNAGAKIVIEGHCDERGTVEYNQALGERRAQAARDYLVQAGIAEARIQIISYGKERPFDPGHDEAAWAKNRRAHFAIQ